MSISSAIRTGQMQSAERHARSLIVVPPLIKYSAGPLLGPALLQASALKRGHKCDVLDLNAHYIRDQRLKSRFGNNNSTCRGLFVGDHDKPTMYSMKEDNEIGVGANNVMSSRQAPKNVLSSIDENFLHNIISDSSLLSTEKLRFGFLTHFEVIELSDRLASSGWFGDWCRDKLLSNVHLPSPDLVGLSLLHAGQVVPAAAISNIVRDIWQDTTVVWGGPHISGIGKAALKHDLAERNFAADVFVTGHAEDTFEKLLDDVANVSRAKNRGTILYEGVRGGTVAPRFQGMVNTLDDHKVEIEQTSGLTFLYDQPPVLPAQSTLGCAYGRCAFCTYPAMEPKPTKLDLCLTIDSVVRQAEECGGTMAVKDSLVTPRRLIEIADVVRGRVCWSACTKLHPKLCEKGFLKALNDSGLSTIEVGLESLLVETQRRVAKVHPPTLFEDFLKESSTIPDLSIIVNYMTGFPWEQPKVSQRALDETRKLVSHYLGPRGKVEHNEFELERMSPMASDPSSFDIDETSLQCWPWASVCRYRRMNNK